MFGAQRRRERGTRTLMKQLGWSKEEMTSFKGGLADWKHVFKQGGPGFINPVQGWATWIENDGRDMAQGSWTRKSVLSVLAGCKGNEKAPGSCTGVVTEGEYELGMMTLTMKSTHTILLDRQGR